MELLSWFGARVADCVCWQGLSIVAHGMKVWARIAPKKAGYYNSKLCLRAWVEVWGQPQVRNILVVGPLQDREDNLSFGLFLSLTHHSHHG